jgi:tagatose 6-phosphate kinase
LTILTVTLHPAIDKVLRVPALRPNEIARCTIEMVHGGGKGNNVARALTRLGVPVIASGYQGGHTGAFITEHLESEGIRTDYVTCQQPTRTSTIVQVDETGNTYPLYEPGQAVTAEEIERLRAKVRALLPKARLMLLCGSGQTELLAPVYADLIEIARQQGVHTLLDSSGETLARGIAARPYMVKVNRLELSGFLGRPLETLEAQLEAMLEIQRSGIALVALSRGEQGLIATDGSQVVEGRLSMERIVNVVGCGDSQLAGIARELLEEAPLAELVRWGVAAGTANTQTRGAGRIDLELVRALLPRVRVRSIAD